MPSPLPQPAPRSTTAADLPYRISWMARSLRAGAHRSRYTGGTGMLRDVVPFLKSPDPRRIDLRQSLRDPFEQLHVRRFEQPASADVVVIADVSGSMGFRGESSKLDIIAQLAETLAHSARRIGDRFGLIACDEALRPELSVPVTRRRGGEADMAQRLRAFTPAPNGASALVAAAQSLTGRTKLIVLVSDFQLPLPDIEAVLGALAGHDILPVVVNDRTEVENLPSWGLMELEDLEGAGQRVVFMRPSLKQRLLQMHTARMANLLGLFSRFTREPLVVTGAIDWQRLASALAGASRC